MEHKARGEQRFGAITYSRLAAWTGLALPTVRAYASRGEFDPRDLAATLQWANARRQRLGLPMIGQPGEILENSGNSAMDTLANVTDSSPVDVTPNVALTSVALTSGYNPRTGDFET